MSGPTGSDGAVHRPLVLVHGVGLDLHLWDLVVSSLAIDRQVVCYDLLGHGRSSDPPGQRVLGDFVDQCLDVLAVARSEDPGKRVPALAGISLGGLITLAVGSRHPEAVAQLVAMNTVFGRTDEQIKAVRNRLTLTETYGMGRVAELAIDRWFTADWQFLHPDRVEAVDRCIRVNDLDSYLKAYRVFADGDPGMPEAASLITAPTLALTGEFDPGSTPAMSRAIASAVINGEFRIFSDLRHLPPIEAPRECVVGLLEFLDNPIQH
ncbi:MAG: alpha/beta fold hydrolase [Acidimicrobiales bacterium]|nr:alpha/beta fold hydrolase [Acidimicrobiales bacterium]